jgi:hypothetical protein
VNTVELEGLARRIMLRHHDPSLGAPGPGTRAWEEAVEPMVETLEQLLACSAPAAVRAFAEQHHEEFRHSLAAGLRQIDLDLRRGDLSPAQHMADHVLLRAYRAGPGVPMPGSFAFERVRSQVVELIESRYTGRGVFVAVIDDVMVTAVRRILLDAHEQEKRGAVEAAERAAHG